MTNIHSIKFLYAYYWRVARMYSQPIPDKYYKLTEQEVDERIYKAKKELGNFQEHYPLHWKVTPEEEWMWIQLLCLFR